MTLSLRPPDWRLVLAALGLACALAVAVSGCGGVSAETRARYSIETAQCIANERAIVDRRGTTLAQDEADLAAERARCDAALQAIEQSNSGGES